MVRKKFDEKVKVIGNNKVSQLVKEAEKCIEFGRTLLRKANSGDVISNGTNMWQSDGDLNEDQQIFLNSEMDDTKNAAHRTPRQKSFEATGGSTHVEFSKTFGHQSKKGI